MEQNNRRLVILTGGPASGKTSVIEALEKAGYSRSSEAGRAIIQSQVAGGGNALPWGDRASFAELMLEFEVRSYETALNSTGTMFFDRGVPDVLGYLRLSDLPVSSVVLQAVEGYRYHRHVFIFPPWPEIFCQDTERKQDFAEAVRTYEALVATYTDCGYELVEMPRATVHERVNFILNDLGLRNPLRNQAR